MFDDLLEANQLYRTRFHDSGVPGKAAKHLAVLTCIDSRIDPLAMLGLKAGDAKIHRIWRSGASSSTCARAGSFKRSDQDVPGHSVRLAVSLERERRTGDTFVRQPETSRRSAMSELSEEIDELGPIDFVLIEFPGSRMGDEAANALLDLVDRGLIRIYDFLAIRKEDDGTFSGLDIEGLTQHDLGSFTAFAGASSGILGDDDLSEAAAAMEPGTTAVLVVFENSWAAPFAVAARKAGGQLIAFDRIPVQQLIARLDELEASAG
jgi:hypothetical protein